MTPRFNYALAAKPLKYKNNNLVIETIDLSAGIPYIYNLATAMQAITHGGLPSQTTAERILVKDWEFNIKFVLNYDTVSRGDKRFRVVCYRVN